MAEPNFPVKITTAAYSGDQPCTRCGQVVTNGWRVVGTKGPDVARWLVLCPTCYARFKQQVQRMMGNA